jgi:chromosome segregation ATPase
MSKASFRNVLVIILVVATVAAVLAYVFFLKKQVVSLENQRQNLLQQIEKGKNAQQLLIEENMVIKRDLEATKQEIEKVRAVYDIEHVSFEELKAKFALLQAENEALRKEKMKVAKEIEGLEQKLAKTTPGKGKPISNIEVGNRGYIIRDGKPTYPSRIRIEVVPANAQ